MARVLVAAGDIKLAHSIFALPFAVLGAFLARPNGGSWSAFAGQLALVVACMVLARTWAMLINRAADADFDRRNPRTARRAVASGRLSRRDALAMAVLCAGGFVAATGGFWFWFANPWPLGLSIPVLGWLALYSFAKRFTSLCHVLLGSALAVSPLAAALAVEPVALGREPALFWLAGMVTLWVAGFDVIYALADADFDRHVGLFSLPSRLGFGPAVWLSRSMHLGAVGCLVMAARSEPRFGLVFALGVVLAALLLATEHAIVERRGLAGLPVAFFTVNGVVSCLLGIVGVLDLFV